MKEKKRRKLLNDKASKDIKQGLKELKEKKLIKC